MKKGCISFVSVICFLLFLSGTSIITYANESKKFETEIGIEIEKSDSQVDPKKPSIIDGGDSHTDYRLLPKTGELLSSLIVILIGISILIFSLGVISLRQLFQSSVWEV